MLREHPVSALPLAFAPSGNDRSQAKNVSAGECDIAIADSSAMAMMLNNDKEPEQNRFIRSDQYSFIRNGVPALAFKFGYESGTPEDKIFHDWIRERYHKPGDDLNQPVDKAAAARFNNIILELTERVANEPERPRWNPDSFFRRFAGQS